MRTLKTIVLGSLFTLGAAYAGLLYLELPAHFDAEMVRNPTDADRRAFAEFTFDELAKLDNRYTVRIVRFTKDGEFIYPEVERTETDAWSDNSLGFHAAGEFLNQAGSWDTAYWHADVPTGVYI